MADASYAPVAIRFSAYQVKLNEHSQQYVDFILNNNYIKSWMLEGINETAIIEEYEINYDNKSERKI